MLMCRYQSTNIQLAQLSPLDNNQTMSRDLWCVATWTSVDFRLKFYTHYNLSWTQFLCFMEHFQNHGKICSKPSCKNTVSVDDCNSYGQPFQKCHLCRTQDKNNATQWWQAQKRKCEDEPPPWPAPNTTCRDVMNNDLDEDLFNKVYIKFSI
jgi:hypothetical protein